ncbi:MAG: hypothetical protein QNJ72_10385 [Pleurocapsa sp. MO_226.B13]|nr:hypothetical protein [Pleurocapsa sp. MO_226.B13]
MQQQQFTHDSRLAGWCWGFGESFVNQQRVTYHAGGLPGFISLLHLFPDLNLGLFSLYSRISAAKVRRQLIAQKGDRDEELPQSEVIRQRRERNELPFEKSSERETAKENTRNRRHF